MVAPQRPFTNYNPINISKTQTSIRFSTRLTNILTQNSILNYSRQYLFMPFDNTKIERKIKYKEYKILR